MMTQVLLLNEEINANKFTEPIGNIGNNKPSSGGLWTSTLNDDNSSDWINFAKAEEIYSSPEDIKVFHIEVSKTARVLYIYNNEQYYDVLEQYGMPVVRNEHPLSIISNAKYVLDYNKIAKDYDAVSLTVMGINSNWDEFYGWDVESTLWLNLDCFESIKLAESSLESHFNAVA